MVSAPGAADAAGAPGTPGGGGAWAWLIAGALPSSSRMTSSTAVARLTISGSSRADETDDGSVEFTSRPGVGADEGLHALPGVGRGVRQLGELPVEEAVRGARVHLHVVLDVGLLERGVELIDVRLRNTLVGAAEERLDRRLVAAHRVDRLGTIRPALEAERPAVEADDAGVAEVARRLQVRQRAAEAEAHREQRAHLATVLAAQVRGRGRDVGLQRLGL